MTYLDLVKIDFWKFLKSKLFFSSSKKLTYSTWKCAKMDHFLTRFQDEYAVSFSFGGPVLKMT